MKSNIFFILLISLIFTSCFKNEPRRPIKKSTYDFYEKIIVQNKKLNKKEEKYIQYLISKDTVNHYTFSNYGFWYYYRIKKEDSYAYPKTSDIVSIEYNISDIHGNEIYPKQQKNYRVDKEDFMPALQDGIKLMKSGEIITFVIPSHRAYGTVGDNNKININQPLISTLKLINIKNKENETK